MICLPKRLQVTQIQAHVAIADTMHCIKSCLLKGLKRKNKKLLMRQNFHSFLYLLKEGEKNLKDPLLLKYILLNALCLESVGNSKVTENRKRDEKKNGEESLG